MNTLTQQIAAAQMRVGEGMVVADLERRGLVQRPHEELRQNWRPDQRWETRIVMTKDGPVHNPVWTPIPLGQEPQWDAHQEYRLSSQVPQLNIRGSNFQQVAAMNTAFGNPAGNPSAIDWDRIAKQSLNVADELAEVFVALGADRERARAAAQSFKSTIEGLRLIGKQAGAAVNRADVRDGLCDIHVFTYGAHHLMGIDADADMNAVIDGVMTRFIKDDADKAATIAKHAAAGVTDVYFEGEYPTMVMKSASDQPDAPKGKFLKSASFSEPVFPPVGAALLNPAAAWPFPEKT